MRQLTLGLLGASALALAAAAPALADVTIATIGPMTGQYAVFGTQMQKGSELAVKEINAQGGINGEQVVLKVGDDACDPKQAVAVANQMVNEDVKAVIGHFCSGSSIPASAVYHEEGILQISPASTNVKLTEQGFENVFRNCGRDDVQGIYAANYVVDNKVASKIAIIDDKSQYGKGLADEFRKQLNARGVKEVLDDQVTTGDKDFSALITKLKSAGVDMIYYGGYHTEAGLIVRQARGQGFNAQLMSADALVDKQYWDITGPTGEGTLMTFPPDPRNRPTAAAVVKSFKDEGYDPEGYTLLTYSALQIYKQAAEKAKSTDLEAITKALHDSTFDTVLGPVSFDAKGDVKAPEYVMFKWHDGAYAQVEG